MGIYYWIKDDEKNLDFNRNLFLIIEMIFKELNYDISFKKIDSDVERFAEVVKSAKSKKSQFHSELLFVISFLEKILRLIYLAIDEEKYFSKDKITLGTIFKSNDYDNHIFCKLIGYNQYRIIRYYLLNDTKGVGYEYRNRLSHFRDIDIRKIDSSIFLKTVWLIITCINSIFISLMNDDYI